MSRFKQITSPAFIFQKIQELAQTTDTAVAGDLKTTIKQGIDEMTSKIDKIKAAATAVTSDLTA